ncbi:MAG: hypothetical protein J7J17_03960, partial [Hadesarchaea archaeon]|nr:hypothetical protein [Hadesarchaea archaeon]
VVSPTPENACRIAVMLRDIGVERIEVMTYTRSDRKGINLMRDEGLGPLLAAWCRAAQVDIDAALEMGFEQIGISHPVSFIHLKKWVDKDVRTLLERVVSAVEYAVDHGLKVFVHGEDSTRADWAFEREFINAVAEAGASVYRICDTVGCGISDPEAPLPNGIPAKVRRIKEETKIPAIEIHAHDDLGNAVENTMAAIRAASGLYEKVYASTTFLGIGDRAGGAETEKVIMNCYFHHGVRKWNLKLLKGLADLVAEAMKYRVPLNKAIVGRSAFAHESGIHVHGVKVLPLTYEIFPPELVGQKREIRIGKRSGKHGVKLKLEEMIGREVGDEDPRLLKLLQLLRGKFVKGRRRTSLTDEEFRQLARDVGFKV